MCVFVFTVSTVLKAMKSRALTAELAMVAMIFIMSKRCFRDVKETCFCVYQHRV